MHIVAMTLYHEYMKTDDVAEYIGVTPRTIKNWRRRKFIRLPFITLGRLTIYRRCDVDAYLEYFITPSSHEINSQTNPL